jgi:hypothetical protein
VVSTNHPVDYCCPKLRLVGNLRRLRKKYKEIFRQTLENRYINGEKKRISRLFLGKEIVRMGLDRIGSKLFQVGDFVISDFELRNLIEYYHSYVY